MQTEESKFSLDENIWYSEDHGGEAECWAAVILSRKVCLKQSVAEASEAIYYHSHPNLGESSAAESSLGKNMMSQVL